MKPAYSYEYTAEELPTAQIRSAIIDGLQYFNGTVWEGVPIDEAKRDPEGKILNGGFVMCNTGDLKNPDCRARYVACEYNEHDDASFFAATPPLEAKRLLLSHWATQRRLHGERLHLHFADARKAYFNGTPERSLYLRLPKELGLGPGVAGRLLMCC